MSSIVFHHECIILDADCIINLVSSGRIVDILESTPCSCTVSQYVHDRELLHNNVQMCVEQELLQVVVPHEEEYDTIININFDVNVPVKVMGDGEIETGTIAIHRNWAIGIDDKTARKYFAKKYSNIQLLTTPELLKHWIDTTKPSKSEVQSVFDQVRTVGNYAIGQQHFLYDWWQSWLV